MIYLNKLSWMFTIGVIMNVHNWSYHECSQSELSWIFTIRSYHECSQLELSWMFTIRVIMNVHNWSYHECSQSGVNTNVHNRSYHECSQSGVIMNVHDRPWVIINVHSQDLSWRFTIINYCKCSQSGVIMNVNNQELSWMLTIRNYCECWQSGVIMSVQSRKCNDCSQSWMCVYPIGIMEIDLPVLVEIETIF